MEITMLTARFVRFEINDKGEKKAIIDVRLDNNVVQRRSFDAILVQGIKGLEDKKGKITKFDPYGEEDWDDNDIHKKNIIISIKTKPGEIITSFISGKRYRKLFKKCGW